MGKSMEEEGDRKEWGRVWRRRGIGRNGEEYGGGGA